jgi:UDP-N-acetylglucosamine pyrophosphorylase
MNKNSNVCAVVLAAGKGTRMKSDLPKVVTLLESKPLILYVIDTLKKINISKIIVVVGYKKEIVMDLLKDTGVEFVEQAEQLGTGHALLSTEPSLSSFQGHLLVCCGDVPFISAISFQSLLDTHIQNQYALTVLSAYVENPTGYGRILRNLSDDLEKIIEEKDASESEKSVKEVNTGTYVFQSPSVFSYLKTLGNDNAQKEYYLPDLIKIYNANGYKTGVLALSNSLESTGINSPEDLAFATSLLKDGKINL